MISVVEAASLITQYCLPLPKITTTLANAFGCYLAEPVLSPTNSPPFDQSAMDGFALAYSHTAIDQPVPLQDEAPAGLTQPQTLEKGKTIRIFTGAPVPQNADTVIIREDVLENDNSITIKPEKYQHGINIRKKGSQIEAGAIAAPVHTALNAGTIGFLASLGVNEVVVHAKPVIGIVVTGQELVQANKQATLQYGQVFESNSITLQAALKQHHFEAAEANTAPDDLDALKQLFAQTLAKTDVMLVTGGVSAGNYDYVPQALQANGVTIVFHKIAQKPGKPILFGVFGNKLVFGLPGNPASVLTCFYQYVLPALQTLMGSKQAFGQTISVPLLHNFYKKGSLTCFFKGQLKENGVTLLDDQESYKLKPFVTANCLVILPAAKNQFDAGDLVNITLIN